MCVNLTLRDVVRRVNPPAPWAEGDNIPWNEPDFSRRMLAEHLCQEHDLASRRVEIIDRQVRWIHQTVLGARPTRILDLACGPGFYTSRLARLGHACAGIDFAPAAIAHAREEAARDHLACTYTEADLRRAEFGERFGLVMMIHGQINVFRREQARDILSRAWAALDEGGVLLLEPQTQACVRAADETPPSWSTSEAGLFSDRPHIVLKESFWDEDCRTNTERFHVIDAGTGAVARYALSSVAYSEEEITDLITSAGFQNIVFHPSLTGDNAAPDDYSFAVVARK